VRRRAVNGLRSLRRHPIAHNVVMVGKPQIFVPGWGPEHLWSACPGQRDQATCAPGLSRPAQGDAPRGQAVALVGAPPSSLDHVSVYVDEVAIGAKPTGLGALREHLSKLPFEPARSLDFGAGGMCPRASLHSRDSIQRWSRTAQPP
jgi:hypothetical protein